MQHLKEFTQTFDTLSHGHNRGSLFADFVEIAACTAHQIPYHAGAIAKDEAFDRIEKNYLDAVKRYDKVELEQIVTLYATATLGVIENRADFLGAAYMQLEIGNRHSGQFFTPPEVSRMMAEITFANAADVIKEKRYITVAEPAAGAGGMLIEAANALQRQGFDPRTALYFEATDIDRTCFNMAYFQLSTLGLTGEVAHGNTLSLEEWDRRATPQLLVIQANLPTAQEAAPSLPAPAQQPEPPPSAIRPARQTEMDFGLQPQAASTQRPISPADPTHRARFQQRDDPQDLDR